MTIAYLVADGDGDTLLIPSEGLMCPDILMTDFIEGVMNPDTRILDVLTNLDPMPMPKITEDYDSVSKYWIKERGDIPIAFFDDEARTIVVLDLGEWTSFLGVMYNSLEIGEKRQFVDYLKGWKAVDGAKILEREMLSRSGNIPTP